MNFLDAVIAHGTPRPREPAFFKNTDGAKIRRSHVGMQWPVPLKVQKTAKRPGCNSGTPVVPVDPVAHQSFTGFIAERHYIAHDRSVAFDCILGDLGVPQEPCPVSHECVSVTRRKSSHRRRNVVRLMFIERLEVLRFYASEPDCGAIRRTDGHGDVFRRRREAVSIDAVVCLQRAGLLK